MAFGDDEGMQKKWMVFTKKIATQTDDFKTVLSTISGFLERPFTEAAKNKK